MRWIALTVMACGTTAAAPDTQAQQCKAIFQTFATLPAGVDAPHAREVFANPLWLRDSDDEPVEVLGGKVPVEMTDADQVFVIRCLKQSSWAIYGRISGHTAKTFGAFLKADKAVHLIEYALMTPDGKIDRHK